MSADHRGGGDQGVLTSVRQSHNFRTNFARALFPDVGRLWVMVPIRTENTLRFSVRSATDEGSWPDLWRAHEPQLEGAHNRLGTVGDPQLGDYVLDVHFGSRPGDEEALGDVLICLTLR